jgi:8-oxo-dGTP diphosphatase
MLGSSFTRIDFGLGTTLVSPDARSVPRKSVYFMNVTEIEKRPDRTRVLAAVVERDGRLLLARRPPGKRHAGLWEFPGGKFLPGETPLEAARRELAEELDVEVVAVGALLWVAPDPGSSFVIEFYDVKILGEPAALEHDALAWVLPEELPLDTLAPSDRTFAESLREAQRMARGTPSDPEAPLIGTGLKM